MKNQHLAVCQLYLTSDFTVTEIANHLGISRRSIQLWAKKGNWNSLRDYIKRHAEMQDFASIRNMAFGMAFFNTILVSLPNHQQTTRNRPVRHCEERSIALCLAATKQSHEMSANLLVRPATPPATNQ